MRANDVLHHAGLAVDHATRDDGTQDATQFGDSLRAAAHRTGVNAAPMSPEASTTRERMTERRSDEQSTPRQASARGAAPPSPPAAAHDAKAPARAPAMPNGDAPPKGGQTAAPASHREDAPAHADAVDDPREPRPRPHAAAAHRAPHRDKRRSTETQPPEGIALQTLLAAANPLLPSTTDVPVASTAPALTPHDVAASVTQAWLHEPPTPDAFGGERGAQWSFTLGDPLTPLAALHIRGDAAAGWGLQLTAGNGLPARELAAHTERLRRRLRARGQAVDHVEVDDDEPR
jgi:hypothetical protein